MSPIMTVVPSPASYSKDRPSIETALVIFGQLSTVPV
jgi:hypothetical protein